MDGLSTDLGWLVRVQLPDCSLGSYERNGIIRSDPELYQFSSSTCYQSDSESRKELYNLVKFWPSHMFRSPSSGKLLFAYFCVFFKYRSTQVPVSISYLAVFGISFHGC